MAVAYLKIVSLLLLSFAMVGALDCRRFSFAPACRGIMLKRSEKAFAFHVEPMHGLHFYENNLMKTPSKTLSMLANYLEKTNENSDFIEFLRQASFLAFLQEQEASAKQLPERVN